MGFLGGLFGRSRIRAPRPSRFADLSRAAREMTDRSSLTTGDKAGVLFNPEDGASASDLANELQGVMRRSEVGSGTGLDLQTDEFETAWIVLHNRHFERLVGSVQLLNETLFERGNGDRLLAAVIRVDFERRPAYWIYNYKRGYFYPLVRGKGGDGRDNEVELRLGESMDRHRVAVESSLEHWYGLSGIPF